MNNYKTVDVKFSFLSDETKKKLLDYYTKKWYSNNCNKVVKLK